MTTHTLRLACSSLALALLLVACGGAAEQPAASSANGSAGESAVAAPSEASTSDDAAASAAPASGYEAVLAEVEGLSAEERWDRLVELAAQEDGTLMVYVSMSADEVQPLMDGFTEATGSARITPEFYRAHTDPVLQRIAEEEAAHARQVDALIMPGTALEELSRDGLLQPFSTPMEEVLVDGAMFGNWVSVYINLYTAAWNTNLVSAAAVPTTWEEVLSYADGPVGAEILSYDWFATLVTDYFMAEQGLSEEEAIQLFLDADFVPVSGRTALTELTTAGEYHIAASTYTQNVDQFIQAGAPIAWEPPVEPLVLQHNGAAPVADSDVPATALLFMDYMLGEVAQGLLAGAQRIPTNASVEAPLTVDKYAYVAVDVPKMVDERERWEGLFAEVTGEPVTGG